jgi:hypothetical protein
MKRADQEKLREEWGNRLKEWKVSGLTQVEYCRRNSLKVSNFYYWNRKISGRKQTVPSFVQVPISPQNRFWSIRIEIENRFSVEVGHGYDPAALEHIIGLLSRS